MGMKFCMRVRLVSGMSLSHFEVWLAGSHGGGITSGMRAPTRCAHRRTVAVARWDSRNWGRRRRVRPYFSLPFVQTEHLNSAFANRNVFIIMKSNHTFKSFRYNRLYSHTVYSGSKMSNWPLQVEQGANVNSPWTLTGYQNSFTQSYAVHHKRISCDIFRILLSITVANGGAGLVLCVTLFIF